MNITAKLPLIALAAALLGGSTSFADDQQLHIRQAQQRAEAARQSDNATTIGVYAQGRTVGRQDACCAEACERKVTMQRDNAHGVPNFYVATKR